MLSRKNQQRSASRNRTSAHCCLVFTGFVLSACTGKEPAPPAASAPPAGLSAAASAQPLPLPPPPLPEAGAIVGAAGDCQPGSAKLAVSPASPSQGAPLRVMAFIEDAGAPLSVVVKAPDGSSSHLTVGARRGPPVASYAALASAQLGQYQFVAHRDGTPLGCHNVTVAKQAFADRSIRGSAAWRVTRGWDRDAENLYSAWIEKLFDVGPDTSLSVGALHELTRDSERNFLFNHLGLNEDAAPPQGLRLDPDCADLPYFLRAYFAFKQGLPIAFSSCTRGGLGQAPRCLSRKDTLTPLDDPAPERVRRFQSFARVRLKDTVHSGTGRTLGTDDFTDYYPVKLDKSALRPGLIYADPYGHILVVASIAPQTKDTPGALFAVDGQPDGTVAQKRFWEGNFLFAQSEAAMGSPGFKRARPVVREGGGITGLSNAQIANHPAYGDYDATLMGKNAEQFYDQMSDLLSPEPLDPTQALDLRLTGLFEQLQARVTSVQNGVAHFERGGARIDMPDGGAIFETSGDWENYSTPSRDLRVLIAIDQVLGFPALVARRTDRFAMPPGKNAKALVADLEAHLKSQASLKTIRYKRSDGSEVTLSVAEVLARKQALEMAYNPNDCPELRWGAAEGSDEAKTCSRRAPGEQHRKMVKHRNWFTTRTRPSRG